MVHPVASPTRMINQQMTNNVDLFYLRMLSDNPIETIEPEAFRVGAHRDIFM